MIYIVKHKNYENPIPDNYKELFVGNLFNSNSVDNINHLNPYINEATGIYQLWRNCEENVIGLCHYRRFFNHNSSILRLEDAQEILKKYDIIITEEVQFNKGIYEQLRSEFVPNDRIILDKYYNKLCEIEPNLKNWFNSKSFNPKEMFVCKKDLFKEYCNWLFPIIIPLTEEFVKKDKEKILNKRMIGHLVERLFAYWIFKKKLKCYKMEYIDI